MREVALAAALAGGVCLVANLFVDLDAVSWTGLGLLGIAVAALGAGVVHARWLVPIAATGCVALGWAVLAVLRQGIDDRELDAVAGGAATLCVAVAMLRPTPPRSRATPPGNHRA